MNGDALLQAVIREILTPIIYLLFAAATVVFLWGGFNFVAKAEDSDARETGRQSLVWGIIGMLVMILAIFIVQVVANSIGAPVPSL